MENNAKPITHQGNLAKLPKALAPLIARPQWAVWRWTQKPDGSWQKPPFHGDCSRNGTPARVIQAHGRITPQH